MGVGAAVAGAEALCWQALEVCERHRLRADQRLVVQHGPAYRLSKARLTRVSSRLAGVSGSAHPGFKLCGIRLWIWQSTHVEDRVRIDALRRFMRETEGGELHAQAATLWWRTGRHPGDRTRHGTARCVGQTCNFSRLPTQMNRISSNKYAYTITRCTKPMSQQSREVLK